MLLREFLQEDMTNYLESVVRIKKKKNSLAEDDIDSILQSNEESPQTSGFVAAKTFEPIAPSIVVQEIVKEESAKSPSSTTSSSHHHESASSDLSPNNDVDDSSSLRRVIREELSQLHTGGSGTGSAQSPSQLRRAIKDELRGIINSGGIDQLAKDESLRSIIHNELERSGALNKNNKYTPNKIHIDESLLNPEFVDDDQDIRVIEIMEKPPQNRTKRDELSVLGKLEDWLVELKMYIRDGNEKDAVSKYRRLKKEAHQLRFFAQEQRFLLEELKLISTTLFMNKKEGDVTKKVILKETSGEIIDPNDFSVDVLQRNHRPVYHIAIDKRGNESYVDPKERSIVVSRNIFGSQVLSQKKSVPLQGKRGNVSHVVSRSDMWTKPVDDTTTFYVQQGKYPSLMKRVYHQKVSKNKDREMDATQSGISPLVIHEVQSDATRKVYIPGLPKKKKNFTPWEDRKQQMHDPQHTNNYLRALRALRQKEKHMAVDLLTDLHSKYPNNMAIKIRLQDALQL